MNIVTPRYYKLLNLRALDAHGRPDPVPVILDPWPTNTPLAYPFESNRTGHAPQKIF
jgi:hypothetical protein